MMPTQELYEPPDNVACNDCAAILELILKDNQGMFARGSTGTSLREFDELTDHRPCRNDLLCLPRVRLIKKKN